MKFFLIGIFGILGVYSRYFIDTIMQSKFNSWPLSTFIINIIGCLAIGVLFSLQSQSAKESITYSALMIGFCGGFTTFSTYSLQALNIFNQHGFIKSFLYISLSVLCGVGAVFIGMKIPSYSL